MSKKPVPNYKCCNHCFRKDGGECVDLKYAGGHELPCVEDGCVKGREVRASQDEQ